MRTNTAAYLSVGLFIAGSGHAQTNVRTVSVPGGYVQTGATTVGESFTAALGNDLEDIFSGDGDTFHEMTFAGNGSANASTNAAEGVNTASASGTCQLGSFGLSASSASTKFGFVKGEAVAVFADEFTISNPALTNQRGTMVFTVAVTGNLACSGIAGAAQAQIANFKDGQLTRQNAFFDNSQSLNIFGTDRQIGAWRISTAGNGTSETASINATITFATEFFYGRSFDQALVGFINAGKRSSTNDNDGSSATANFANTFTWTGIQQILDDDGNPVADAEVITASGLDYFQDFSAQPCLPDVNNDGMLNGADFNAWLTAFQTTDPAADQNQDGMLNGADFNAWLTNFQNGC